MYAIKLEQNFKWKHVKKQTLLLFLFKQGMRNSQKNPD